ncbi:putative cobalt transporter CbtC [Candidatus Rhodobacter oscarellae]|uniref:Putative cobalt transporter CbtC n=1 Tax=Candidatus Rhodobacter oscarellae TaxID=1675527 RepID=A0A0J9H4F7_9RHOB|nr:energy-coupling factor ABC transporter permease [Candidatus Rhodobacter lobularis]KMW60543.1 putative cobalt transporter CbtC [Candidatus Rhodobacter lobularis]
MHIEPGVVHGAKMVLAYGTAAGAAGYAAKLAWDDLKANGAVALATRAVIATVGVLFFFEILPKFPVGVSEVHFILGTTLLLILGAAPAAIGLAAGLAIQSLFLAPPDAPMYFVNVTTLLVPIFAIAALARRIVAPNTAYVDLKYGQALTLSGMYQGGVIAWVAFWAFYGQGFGAENMAAVMSFAAAYILVVLVEPLIDLAVLAGAKAGRDVLRSPALTTPRLYKAA